MTRITTLLALAAAFCTASADHNVTVQASDTTDISYSGTWLNQGNYCLATRYTSTIGDFFTFTFTGTAVYVIGTVGCDWSGLINISLDGNTKSFDQGECLGNVCDYPWFTATRLQNSAHTVNVTLASPPLSEAPSKPIIADFRYILYTASDSTSATGSLTSTSTSASATSSAGADTGSQHKSVNGALIGGVVAGVVILVLLGIIIFLLLARKRARERQPHPIDLGAAEQHPLSPSLLTAPLDTAWMPWTDTGVTPDSQTSTGKSFSRSTSTENLVPPAAAMAHTAGPGSSSGQLQSDRTDFSGQQQSIGNMIPATARPDLVQRISETVAAMLREQDASPPPAYEPPPAAPPRPRKR